MLKNFLGINKLKIALPPRAISKTPKSIQHPQHIPANPLQLVTRFRGKSSKLCRPCIGINHCKHRIPRLLWKGPLDSFSLILIKSKLPIKALNGFQGIIYRTFHREANLVPLPAQFNRHLIQNQRKFIQDLCGHMPVRCRELRLRQHRH